jgi:hypothetical protein
LKPSHEKINAEQENLSKYEQEVLFYNREVNFEDLQEEKVLNDSPEPWGLFFQDNATPQMEGLEELHNNIMYYLAIILFAVT